MKKRSKSGREINLGHTTLMNVILSVISFVLLSLIASLILCAVSDPLRWMGVAFALTLLISGALASFIVTKRHKSFGIYPSTISSVGIILVIFSVGLIKGGDISLSALIIYLAYIISGILASILAKRENRRRRHRR